MAYYNHDMQICGICFVLQVHLGVIEKNETKTADMVDIMSYAQQFPSKEHSSMVGIT